MNKMVRRSRGISTAKSTSINTRLLRPNNRLKVLMSKFAAHNLEIIFNSKTLILRNRDLIKIAIIS